MYRQTRVLIGDVGDPFATICADSLRRDAIWAVTRRQTIPEMLRAFRVERPDIVILNAATFTMDVLTFIRPIRDVTDARIIVLLMDGNPFLEHELESLGAAYVYLPDSFSALTDMLLEICGKQDSLPEYDVSDTELEVEITEMLLAMGMQINLQGFHFLRRAIRYAYRLPSGCDLPIGAMYEEAAAHYESDVKRVEHAIRHAITRAWASYEKGEIPRLVSLPGVLHAQPSNSECIALFSEWLRLRHSVHAYEEQQNI